MTTIDNAALLEAPVIDGNILIAPAVLAAASFFFICGRLYAHLRLIRTPHSLDDIFVVTAWFFSFANVVVLYRVYHYAVLIQPAGLQPDDLQSFFHYTWLFIWIYNTSLSFTKFSIIIQYKRMFVTPEFQIAVKCILAMTTIYSLWTIIASIIPCWPIHFFWARAEVDVTGQCLDAEDVFLGNSISNIFTDLIILISPLPVLAKMHLPIRQKISLFVLFSVGGLLVLIISIIRLIIFSSADLSDVFDIATKYVPLGVWSSIEVSVGITCSSIPALKPLVVKVFPSFGSTNSRRTNDNVHGMTPEMSGDPGMTERTATLGTIEMGMAETGKGRGKGSEGGISLQGLAMMVPESIEEDTERK
ncbi:hypothetical protein B9Z65_3707 [Elsinoe australis]|uniref:Rhodopsin domain-containing protein n=1 Tax=Elsinoe australis TaxID=40998 RepID=A0A2P8AFZ5_9PEZI|nr:hypothetical protein B9Z65_3707 [Elsinoe australis]